jgi:exodeoxyribonuclease III
MARPASALRLPLRASEIASGRTERNPDGSRSSTSTRSTRRDRLDAGPSAARTARTLPAAQVALTGHAERGGQAVGSEKYSYKLAWLAALRNWLADEIQRHPNLVVLGDFNIAPDDRDVYDPVAWGEQILCSPPERAALRQLQELGLSDSYRLFHEEGGQFSWWDYRQAGFQRNLGLRIDLVLVSDALRASATAAGIDREPRTWERPSDHAPVWVDLRP